MDETLALFRYNVAFRTVRSWEIGSWMTLTAVRGGLILGVRQDHYFWRWAEGWEGKGEKTCGWSVRVVYVLIIIVFGYGGLSQYTVLVPIVNEMWMKWPLGENITFVYVVLRTSMECALWSDSVPACAWYMESDSNCKCTKQRNYIQSPLLPDPCGPTTASQRSGVECPTNQIGIVPECTSRLVQG